MGGSSDGTALPQPVLASLELLPVKTFRITWQGTPDAQSYRILENPDGLSGFTEISGKLNSNTTEFNHYVALYSRLNAQYLVQACNNQGCVDSEPLRVTGRLDKAIGYFKASNSGAFDQFGVAISLSADGHTMAVGAQSENSGATGIDGNQSDNTVAASGAVYVFARRGGTWEQQAYLKASNTKR